MKTICALFIIVLACCISASAQDDAGIKNQLSAKPQSSMFVELGGQGLLFTFNGDFRLSAARNNMGLRIGIGYFNVEEVSIVTIPMSMNFLFGKNGKYFETGLGVTFVTADADIFDRDARSVGTMFFGYRSQPVDGGFNFRAGLTVLFHPKTDEVDSFFIPYYPGVSFGYTFE